MVIPFVVALLIQSGAFYLAAKWTGNETPFKGMLVIALIGALLTLIPVVGGVIALGVTVLLLGKIGRMEFYPDAILTVIIAGVLVWGAQFLLR